MTVDRPYRKRFDQETAFEELMRCSGAQFDPDVVLMFIKLMRREGEQTPCGVAQWRQPHGAGDGTALFDSGGPRIDA